MKNNILPGLDGFLNNLNLINRAIYNGMYAHLPLKAEILSHIWDFVLKYV